MRPAPLKCYEFSEGWTTDITGGESWVNPLPDGTSLAKREPEKKTRFAGLFFLTSLWPVLPSVGVHPANRIYIRCSSNIAIADHFPSKTFSFKHHLTGEAWPACRAILPFQTPH